MWTVFNGRGLEARLNPGDVPLQIAQSLFQHHKFVRVNKQKYFFALYIYFDNITLCTGNMWTPRFKTVRYMQYVPAHSNPSTPQSQHTLSQHTPVPAYTSPSAPQSQHTPVPAHTSPSIHQSQHTPVPAHPIKCVSSYSSFALSTFLLRSNPTTNPESEWRASFGFVDCPNVQSVNGSAYFTGQADSTDHFAI